jgi:hypothetical protein
MSPIHQPALVPSSAHRYRQAAASVEIISPRKPSRVDFGHQPTYDMRKGKGADPLS